MAGKDFTTKTVASRKSIVDDRLKPDGEIHILVGGPYSSNGETHRYGHTAIRIETRSSDLTYDFGRYGRVTGDLGAEGEGILRVWSNFDTYINGENATGRTTKGYTYLVFEHQAVAATEPYNALIESAKRRSDLERGRPGLKVYQLTQSYHALGYNCTTLSLDGISKAVPKYENGSSDFINPADVLTWTERAAMATVGGGTPSRLFLPANLQDFLDTKPAVRANRTIVHGGEE